MTAILTDVDVMVEGAFDELECLCDFSPCGGNGAAYYTSHSSRPCVEGWLCREHLRYFVEEFRPTLAKDMREFGRILCARCKTRHHSVDDFCKVMTL